jgi:hypothetical protein
VQYSQIICLSVHEKYGYYERNNNFTINILIDLSRFLWHVLLILYIKHVKLCVNALSVAVDQYI